MLYRHEETRQHSARARRRRLHGARARGGPGTGRSVSPFRDPARLPHRRPARGGLDRGDCTRRFDRSLRASVRAYLSAVLGAPIQAPCLASASSRPAPRIAWYHFALSSTQSQGCLAELALILLHEDSSLFIWSARRQYSERIRSVSSSLQTACIIPRTLHVCTS
jgi:hypothetical protein